MLGSDAPLLRIRSKVLSTIGCETNIVYSEEEARQELSSGRQRPELVVLCHTADDDHADKVRCLALQAGVPTYSVERLVPPQQLVADVRRVLKQDGLTARAARVRSSA
jgi:hypothetical protein